MSELAAVWTPASLVSAIAGGLGIGYFVIGHILRDPRFSSGQATPADVAKLVVRAGTIIGIGFYIGQVLSTLFEGGEDLAWRVISRFSLWLLYTICLAVGAAWSTHVDERDRYLKARDQVKRTTTRRGGR